MNTKQQLQNKLVNGTVKTWEVVVEGFALYAHSNDATKVFQVQLGSDLTKPTWDFAIKQSGGYGFSGKATQFVLDLGTVGGVKYITESHVKRAKMVLGQVQHWGKELDKAHRYFEVKETDCGHGHANLAVVFRTNSKGELLIIEDLNRSKGDKKRADLNAVNKGKGTTAPRKDAITLWDSEGNAINITKTFDTARDAIDHYKANSTATAVGDRAKAAATEKLAVAVMQYRDVIRKAINDHNDLIENCSGLRADKLAMPTELNS